MLLKMLLLYSGVSPAGYHTKSIAETHLWIRTRRHHETLDGILAANQVATVVNRTFTDTVNLTLRNPDGNAPIVFWLAADGEEDTPPAEAVEVQPGHAVNTKPSALGPLENTFLQVKNGSAVNEGAYEVVIA